MIIELVKLIKNKDPYLKAEQYYFSLNVFLIIFLIFLVITINVSSFFLIFLLSFLFSIVVCLILITIKIKDKIDINKVGAKDAIEFYYELLSKEQLLIVKNYLSENKLLTKTKVLFLIDYFKNSKKQKVNNDWLGYIFSIFISLLLLPYF